MFLGFSSFISDRIRQKHIIIDRTPQLWPASVQVCAQVCVQVCVQVRVLRVRGQRAPGPPPSRRKYFCTASSTKNVCATGAGSRGRVGAALPGCQVGHAEPHWLSSGRGVETTQREKRGVKDVGGTEGEGEVRDAEVEEEEDENQHQLMSPPSSPSPPFAPPPPPPARYGTSIECVLTTAK
jgi:hypothetical protein